MDDDMATLELAVVVAFIAVAIGFLIFVQSGGFLQLAIDRAIEDGRVILGMTKDDVISSWGRPYKAEEHSIQVMDVDEPVASTWTYENPHRTVHFSNDGIVIWVACD
jgi:hypothetical protein